MNNKAHLRPQDYDSNGDIIPMEIVAGKCPIEADGNCPLRPQDEWIIKDISFHKYSYTCPLCKTEYVDNYDGYFSVCDFNFCPNCGADMRKGGAE